MERRHQERLVGAAVIVLLAAVIVPWLLDGSPERWRAQGRDPGVAPALQRRTLDLRDPGTAPDLAPPAPPQLARVPRAQATAGEGAGQHADVPPARRGEAARGGAAPGEAPVGDRPSSGARSSAGTRAGDARSTGASAPDVAGAVPRGDERGTAASGARAGGAAGPAAPPAASGRGAAAGDGGGGTGTGAATRAPGQGADTVAVAGWAVQVGSFRERANAQALARQLSRKGYRAFVSRHTIDDQIWYRVRVGTEQTRRAAEQAAARLAREGRDTAVVRHP